MSNASRNREHIALLETDTAPGCAPENDSHLAFGNSQHLMRIGMKMGVVVNCVRPNSRPAIALEGLTKPPGLRAGFGARAPLISTTGNGLFGTSEAFSKY